MADYEHTRQEFEDRCWQMYLDQRRRYGEIGGRMDGDIDGDPTREGLFWRTLSGQYGVQQFNAAWQAWCWAMAHSGKPREDDLGLVPLIRVALQVGHGCSARHLAKVLAVPVGRVRRVLDTVPGFYIDRWKHAVGGWLEPIYDVAEAPADCPRPEGGRG